jgi:3-oxoadipate enol-lactonase
VPKKAECSARDGAKLRYTLHEAAQPGAPRLALVHSLALDRTIWDGVVAALGGGVEVLTYDCRGHGASEKPPGPYTTELFAGDLRDVLASLGWERAIVAGASMGGSVALQFAISYPAMVEALGAIDTTAWYGADAHAAWRERANKARAEGLASMVAFQQTRWFSDVFRTQSPAVAARFEQIFLANDVAAYAATCDMLGNFDLRAQLASIGVPVEILVGEEDYATPPDMARALEAGIARSHLTIVPNARHLTPIEIPERIAALLQRLANVHA